MARMLRPGFADRLAVQWVDSGGVQAQLIVRQQRPFAVNGLTYAVDDAAQTASAHGDGRRRAAGAYLQTRLQAFHFCTGIR